VLKSWFDEVSRTAKLLRLKIEREEEDAMQIILQEDVEKLGTRGEVVKLPRLCAQLSAAA